MAIAILSPHLDDAVLSCWHLLTQPGDVLVVNVFTGVPAASVAPAWWDQLTGATDSVQRVRERIAEDRAALRLARRTPTNLGFLDEQYREDDQPLEPLIARIRRHIQPDMVVYGPAALGGHVDHALVRAAALELRTAGFDVGLYADLPHAILHGWPSWVTGGGPYPDVAAALWERSLSGTGIEPRSMAPVVHRLPPPVRNRKLLAVRAYASQLEGLDEFARRSLAEHETLGYEVLWTLPLTVRRRPSPAGEGQLAAPRPRDHS